MWEKIKKILQKAGVDLSTVQADLEAIADDYISMDEFNRRSASLRKKLEGEIDGLKEELKTRPTKEEIEAKKAEIEEAKKKYETDLAAEKVKMRREVFVGTAKLRKGSEVAFNALVDAAGYKFGLNDKDELILVDDKGAQLYKDGKVFGTIELLAEMQKNHDYMFDLNQTPQGRIDNSNPAGGAGKQTKSWGAMAAEKFAASRGFKTNGGDQK